MGRDKGKGGRGGGRGGGRKMYIQNVDELELRNGEVEDQKAKQRLRRGDDDDEEGGSGSGSDNDEKAPDPSVFGFQGTGGAGQAPKVKVNPNLASNQPKNMKLKDLKSMGDALPAEPDAGMNRKEREAAEEVRKKEAWMKRHLAGETDQAKDEMKKLAIVRERREAAKAKREGEGRGAGWEPPVDESSDSSDDSDSDEEMALRMKAPTAGAAGGQKVARGKNGDVISLGAMTKETAEKKKKAAMGTLSDSSDSDSSDEEGLGLGAGKGKDNKKEKKEKELPALNNMEMKKMNPNDLKEHLKARNQSVQGAKKDLLKRLMDFEAARK